MRKFLVFLAVIFMFFCGIKETNAANYTCTQNFSSQIETLDNVAYNATTKNNDKYFSSCNVQNSYELIFEGFGSLKNCDFCIKNLFVDNKNNLNFDNLADVYLLSFSSVPRAP